MLTDPAPRGGTRRPTLPRTGNWMVFQSTATYEESILRGPPRRAGDSMELACEIEIDR